MSSTPRKAIWIPVACIIAAAAVVAGLELSNTTHWLHAKPESTTQAVTGGPTTKGDNPPPGAVSTPDTQSSTSDNNSSSPKSGSDQNASLPSNQPIQDLLTPRGPFVSNHKPNLGGHPAPNSENSACSTTSGVTCQIIFTKDGVTKKLPAQMTDKGGSTYWNGWTLQSVGLTQGNWKVTAIARLGSQTKTASDAMTLDVAP